MIGIACCLVSVAFPGGVYACYSFLTANVFFPQDKVDLGKIPTAGRSSFTITLINNHPSRLRIYRVATSCGCTVASANVKSVPPFGSALITGSITPSADGQSMKEIAVFTNQGSAPAYLTYTAVEASRPFMGQVNM